MAELTPWEPFRWRRGWDPFKELEDMERRLSTWVSRPLRRREGGEETLTVTEWAPLVDIEENDKEYVIKAELPEMKKEEIKVSVEDDILCISGERKREKKEKDKKYHRAERNYGCFERSFTLPDDADGTKVDAEYKDGILKVHLPKSEKAKPKAIEVKVV